VGPQAGRKVFTLQTLPACDEPFDDPVGKVAGFSLAQASLSTGSRSHLLDELGATLFCVVWLSPSLTVAMLRQSGNKTDQNAPISRNGLARATELPIYADPGSPSVCTQTDPFLSGSTGVAIGSCFHSCRAARGFVDHKNRPWYPSPL